MRKEDVNLDTGVLNIRPVSYTHLTLVQYDYRHPIDRELFSCVKPTLEECRAARDKWLNAKKGKEDRQMCIGDRLILLNLKYKKTFFSIIKTIVP